MKTIILATDYSSAASNAANYAADMAVTLKAGLLLLNVPIFPLMYSDMPPLNLPGEIMENAQGTLNELRRQLEKKTSGKIRIETQVQMGSFFTELKTVCESVRPFAVVMGSQGTTSAERLFFGSNTVFAMEHLMWPIIAIPQKAKFSGIKRIVLACDFKKVVNTTPVNEIEELVKSLDAKFYVINIGASKEHGPEMVFQSGLLQSMLENLQPEYHFVTGWDIDQGVLDFCENNNINMIIMIHKRHSLLDKLLQKSHTKELILHSYLPVMALHESD